MTDHPAQRDPAADVHVLERRDEMSAADVVEVHVEAVRRDPPHSITGDSAR